MNNKVDFSKIPNKTLEEYNIIKFNGVDKIFDFLFDEDYTKEDVISSLTEQMKKDIALSQENVRFQNGVFYYGSDIYDLEEEIFKTQNTQINKEEKIEKGKKDVQELMKAIFEAYKDTKEQNMERVNYKMSIYNNSNWLDSNINNVDYSDLLGCMLDIEEEFNAIKPIIDNTLIEINKFKEEYFESQEETEEDNEESEEIQ